MAAWSVRALLRDARRASGVPRALCGRSPPGRTRATGCAASSEQALVFAGASFASAYAPGGDTGLLCLVESAGVPGSLYGLREGYPVAGHSPVADAHRDGRPVRLGPGDVAGRAESRRAPCGEFSLEALPVRRDGGGCLLAVTEDPGGFGPDARAYLERIAEAVKPTGIGWEATGGRGVLLVEAVSAAWGTLPAGGGKQVWCEIPLSR